MNQGVANCVGMSLGGNLEVLGARVSMVRAALQDRGIATEVVALKPGESY